MNNFNKFCFRGGRSEGAKGANALPPLFWKLENKASQLSPTFSRVVPFHCLTQFATPVLFQNLVLDIFGEVP